MAYSTINPYTNENVKTYLGSKQMPQHARVFLDFVISRFQVYLHA
ncbi:hypothetical protein [Acetobacter senegalensis]|nr:hypothetical protein [Acetobacter senegalensis]